MFGPQVSTAGSYGTSTIGTSAGEVPSRAPIGPRYRVLIVDDAASTRRIVGSVLESCRDYEVVGEATDGRAAVELAHVLRPDVVLLDMSMPFVDGSKALKGVLQSAPHAKVIVFSGATLTKGTRLVEAGAVGFIEKGITPFELLRRVGEILDESAGVVLDPVVFEELHLLVGPSGDDRFTELVTQFTQETEMWLAQVRQAVDTGDAAAVGRIAHTIKGSAGQLGGRRLALSCTRLEDDANRGSLSECAITLSVVENDYLELRHELTD